MLADLAIGHILIRKADGPGAPGSAEGHPGIPVVQNHYDARMTGFLLSQILAAIAFACGIISFQNKRRRVMLFWLSGSAVVNGCHFFVLGRPCPGILLLILGARSFVAAFTVDRKAMYLFIGVVLFAFFFSYTTPLGILALFATLLATYASFQRADQRIRVLLMICAATWFVHNVLAQTPVAALMEAAFLTSNLVGYWRFYRSRKSARAAGI